MTHDTKNSTNKDKSLPPHLPLQAIKSLRGFYCSPSLRSGYNSTWWRLVCTLFSSVWFRVLRSWWSNIQVLTISSHDSHRSVHHVASGRFSRRNNSAFCVSTFRGDPHLHSAWNVLHISCTVSLVKVSLLLLFVLEIECSELWQI